MSNPSAPTSVAASGYRHYLSGEYASSLDSLEGVPDWFEPRPRPEEQAAPQRWVHDALGWAGVMIPGVAMALLLAWLGYLLSEAVGEAMHYGPGRSPVSPIIFAVVLGLLIRNTVGVPKTYEAGLRLCLKTILRVGIVILGFTLTIKAIGTDVVAGLPIVLICITTALLVVTWVNKALGLPRRLGTLIAIGTSICGVSAIVATAPIIDAEDDETSYAVACITVFGLLALLTYPFLAHWMFATDQQAGLFLGTAIHDTSQVAGAALSYYTQYNAKQAMATAVTVKLVRNLCMSVLIPLMAILYHRGTTSGGRGRRQKWHQVLPLFVVGFVLLACLRSIGDMSSHPFGVFSESNWAWTIGAAKFLYPWCLAIAMAAVGLGTGLAKLRGLGWKPFSVGFAAALLVGGVSTALIKLVLPLFTGHHG
jgi:uncharacterized integral membrane protein (TIGR00698 family)